MILDAARHSGINLIDTADVYSEGLSERFVGASIKKHRDYWVIATKVGVRSGESPSGKGRKECILRRVEESLRRLGIEYIDLYQMHHFDPETPIEETLECLHGLVLEGKVRYIGASNYSEEQLRSFQHTAMLLRFTPFTAVQSQYNLLKREIETVLFPVCRQLHVGVMIYGALARGVLGGKYRWGQSVPAGSRASTSASIKRDLNESVLKTVEGLAAFADLQGKSVGELALAWVLRRIEVSTVLVGVRNVAQLLDNVNAVNWTLSDADLIEVDRIIGEMRRYRSSSWGSFVGL
jgi:aryl-alcohol dehydrogenase-like predicted oxidoreductase